ncbi:MAG: Gfo/Idh/MocA family oxidoreductase [Phycisphaerae bacterium]|nr:Gfo/Idh/MocA family oxidoreductase [Phycisphaerae bacterium]
MSFKVAVIGVGRMGKLHARVLSELDGAELVCVVDANPSSAQAVAKQRDCEALTDVADVVGRVDAAVVTVPTIAHLDVAEPFVRAGKSVLIEKPFTNDLAGGQALIDLAADTGAKIQIGHTERFNPATLAMRSYDIRPKFIEAHRISPFTFRSADVGVVLDMMIHDIDLVNMFVGSDVVDVQAVGVNVIGKTEDICNARLRYADGCVANITASRLAIKTERKMRLFSEEHYCSVDYGRKVGIVIEKSKNLDLIQMARDMDVDDIAELAQSVDYKELLKVEELHVDDSTEPLGAQARAFRDSVVNDAPVACGAVEGLSAVKTAHRIVEEVRAHRWDGEASPRAGLDIIQKA